MAYPASIADEFACQIERASTAMLTHWGCFRARRGMPGALERIIEKAGEVDVTALPIVAAIQA